MGNIRSQKQKRIAERQIKINRKRNEAVASGDDKKAGKLYEKTAKLQEKYYKAGDAKRKVYKYGKGGENLPNAKVRQVVKDGVVKKTVTRSPGKVEKEIERGNKRIEVRKYKDEGVKTRTKINMKKNKKYKEDFVAQNDKNIKAALDFASNLKSSTFKNMPKQMFDNANSSQNTQIDGKISESKPLFTPFKYSAPSVQEKKSMYINDIKRNIKRDIINTTMDVIKKSSTEAAEEKKNK